MIGVIIRNDVHRGAKMLDEITCTEMTGFVSIPTSSPWGSTNSFRQQYSQKGNSCSTRFVTVCASPVSDNKSVPRRTALVALLQTVTAATVSFAVPFPALADHTLQSAKRAFDRYYPRIAAGGETLRSLAPLLSRGDVGAISEAVSQRDFDVKFRRALNIYATSFSDNYIGQKTKDLQYCANRLFDELSAMKNVQAVDENVMEHYTIAVQAYSKYVRIARLPQELLDGFKV